MKMPPRHIMLLTGLGITLIIIVVSMLVVILSPSNDRDMPVNEATPTQSQPLAPTRPLYSSGSAQKMIDKTTNRTPLSSTDLVAKENILSLLPAGQVSGILYQSPRIVIDYTRAADQFQVEILTIDVAIAKNEAVNWFTSNGMSRDGICDLPVVFYLRKDIADQLSESGFQFNPLAEGC